MYARTTLFEIDPLRISLDAALARFVDVVRPALRQQAGCEGYLVLETPEGKGMLLTLWESEEAASASIQTGFYDEQVSKFLMFLKQPPGRDQYEVVKYELWNSLATEQLEQAGGETGVDT
jgi:quinol monooxygenase YgiN